MDNGKEILDQLKILTKLSALSVIEGKKTLSEQVKALDYVGFKPKEMAGLLGRTPNSIRVALFETRRRSQKKGGK